MNTTNVQVVILLILLFLLHTRARSNSPICRSTLGPYGSATSVGIALRLRVATARPSSDYVCVIFTALPPYPIALCIENLHGVPV